MTEPMKSFEELAEELGARFEDFIGLGDWFVLREEEVIVARGTRSGYPFAETKAREGRDGRRVVLPYEPIGPVTRVFPRSSDQNGDHLAHADCEDSCRIDLEGEICFHVPCTVKTEGLKPRKWSCTETDAIHLALLEKCSQ